MKCYNHQEIEAEFYCQQCGKPCCKDCITKIDDLYYCNECKQKHIQKQGEGNKSPFLAGFLSFIFPGIGQYYNNQYLKGTSFILFFIGIIYQLASNYRGEYSIEVIVIYATSLVFVWLLSIIDAYENAYKINKGIIDKEIALIIYWAIILILVGIFLILINYDVIPQYYLYKSWSLILIVVGLRFLVKIIFNKRRGEVSNE